MSLSDFLVMDFDYVPRRQTLEEQNGFRSASEFVSRLAFTVKLAGERKGKDSDLLIECLLADGSAIDVSRISPEGHDWIRVEGDREGRHCVVVAHQASVQVLCTIVKREPERPPKPPIGFGQAPEKRGQ